MSAAVHDDPADTPRERVNKAIQDRSGVFAAARTASWRASLMTECPRTLSRGFYSVASPEYSGICVGELNLCAGGDGGLMGLKRRGHLREAF